MTKTEEERWEQFWRKYFRKSRGVTSENFEEMKPYEDAYIEEVRKTGWKRGG